MSAIVKFCIRILIASFLASTTFSFPTAPNGVEIVTYGDPCTTVRHLPYQIEGPRKPPPPPKNPLKMQLKVIPALQEYESPCPVPLPMAIQILQETPEAPDCKQGKSYGYNLDVPLTIPKDISKSYNFGLQVPAPESNTNTVCGKPLTNLVSKVDRILIPACEVPNSVKTYGCNSCN